MPGNRWANLLGEKILEREGERRCYIPYTDSNGNKLAEDEILFTNEESFQGKQRLEVWGTPKKEVQMFTVRSSGVEMIYDDAGNFPVALKSPEGELMYLKVSAKTGEVLPIHAGCCQSLDGIYTGAPRAGKTMNILQMSDPAFHDTIVKNTNCSIEDDLPTSSPARKRYEEAGRKLKEHMLPESTKRGEDITPYVYYITYTEEDRVKHMLLRLQDIDGQECIDLTWKSKVFPYNYFLLTIGADELIAGEQGLPVQYTKVVDKLISRLRVLRGDNDYEMLVIITKCDLLDHQNPYLKNGFQNSIEMVNGRMKQTTHDKGFDFAAFQQRGECVQAYLKEECPNFYNKLLHAIPKQKLSFCMIASIGSECDGNSFEDYEPFCIDEPLLSILARNGMYPVCDYGERLHEETVQSFSVGRGIRNRLKSLLEISEDDEFDEDEFYEDE